MSGYYCRKYKYPAKHCLTFQTYASTQVIPSSRFYLYSHLQKIIIIVATIIFFRKLEYIRNSFDVVIVHCFSENSPEFETSACEVPLTFFFFLSQTLFSSMICEKRRDQREEIPVLVFEFTLLCFH